MCRQTWQQSDLIRDLLESNLPSRDGTLMGMKKQRIPVVLIDHGQNDREVITWFHVHSGNDALQDVTALGSNRYQIDTTSGRHIFSVDWNSGHVALSAIQEKEH